MINATLDTFAVPRIVTEHRSDGTLLLRSAEQLDEYAPTMVHAFREEADRHPDRVLAARRDGERWQTLSWGQARRDADALAQAFLDRELGPERPVMVLSGNSLEHLAVMLGAFTAGTPVLPISPSYSLASRDHQRIRAIARLCRPGLVFADDGDAYADALNAVAEVIPADVVIATGSRTGAERLADMMAMVPTETIEQTVSALRSDSVAKVLFTSGSTGEPKGVITTHRMLCSNQQALAQIWPFLRHEPPVLVDWLPWSHSFGGSHNLGQLLVFGGTLYIDEGKPMPGHFGTTVDALRAIAPTAYFNVPAGYALLAPVLESDPEFAEHFFSRLRFMLYAAAALPESLWARLKRVSEQSGHEIPLTAAWGTTETGPGATSAHFASAACGCIGVPLPGVTLKLVPSSSKLEVRVSGPNITPGYYRNEATTTAVFDEEGFYRPGDAARLVDPADPNRGLMFDGRLSEDFKLTTGTWVHVGAVRTALLSASAGILTNAVIAGSDRDFVAALGWVNDDEAQRACDRTERVSLTDPRLRQLLAESLASVNISAGAAGSVRRLLLLDEPPQIDAGEITDKGYINARAVLDRRAAAVDLLYDEPLAAEVITGP